jgi:hypothetical protein
MKIGQIMKIDNIDLYCQNSCGIVGIIWKKLFEIICLFGNFDSFYTVTVADLNLMI